MILTSGCGPSMVRRSRTILLVITWLVLCFVGAGFGVLFLPVQGGCEVGPGREVCYWHADSLLVVDSPRLAPEKKTC